MITRRSFLSMAAAAVAARPLVARQSSPSIDAARLRNRLERLSYHGRPSGGTFADGVSRVAYSTADLTARAWIIDEIKQAEIAPRIDARSEERRVGKEWRCRWSQYHEKKNEQFNERA